MTNFDDFLAEVHTVAIGGHIRPDGDCVGSCLATYNYIKTWYPDIYVTVYLEPIPNIFKFMARSNEIVSDFSGDTVYDLFIAQDCGDTGRLGGAAHFFEQAKHTVCVDHHISNQSFAQDNYIFPQASSASELVYELLPKERITKEIAECIYTGMVHDTGVFQYSCTSRKTMEITEVIGYENGEIQLNPLYVFEEDENTTLEKVSGSLKRTKNKMQNVFKLQLAGIKVEV